MERKVFEIEAEDAVEFFDKIKAEEYVVRITDNGWSVSAVDREMICYTNILLKRNTFFKYDLSEGEEIKIPVADHNKMLAILKGFRGKMLFNVLGKMLVVSSKDKVARMILGHPDVIKEKNPPNIEIDGRFKVSSSIFEEALKNASVLKVDRFSLKVENGEFKIVVSDGMNEIEEKTKVEYRNCQSMFSRGFKEVFGTLKGDLLIGLRDNYPLIVEQKKKSMNVKYFIAPYVEEEVKEEKVKKEDEQ